MKVCPICNADYGGGEGFCPIDGARLGSLSDAPNPLDPDDPLIGTTLGERYKIIRQIGEGGMGIVYEAMHVVIEKHVALKVLRDDFSKRPEVVQRFRQEAKSASRIGHENIVDISDFGETPSGQSYFVMEHLEGEDLANVLARDGVLATRRAADIVLQCCRALGAAHAKGIVHRDMKPENIFLVKREAREDFVKIVDFGIAKMSDIETDGAPGRKLTKTGMIFGTPEYMSPEQAAGKALDHRVDVYACGVILFETLCGRVPFVGDTFMGILTQHMFEPPPTLRAIKPDVDCSAELEEVIGLAMLKDPEQRFASMDEFGRAVALALDMTDQFPVGDPTLSGYGDPVKARRKALRKVSPARGLGGEFPHSKRSPARTGLLLLGALGLLGAGAVLGYRALGADGVEPLALNGPTPIQVADAGIAPAADPAVPVAALASDAGAADSSAGEPRGPEMVTLWIQTRPAGARVSILGRGTVCPSSPCSFETPAGQSIRLTARRGRGAAVRELTPDRAMNVEMLLRRRGRRPGGMRGHSRMGTMGMGMTGRSHMAGDLKVPSVFQ